MSTRRGTTAALAMWAITLSAWIAIGLTGFWPPATIARAASVRIAVTHESGKWVVRPEYTARPAPQMPLTKMELPGTTHTKDTVNREEWHSSWRSYDSWIFVVEITYGVDNQSGIWPVRSWQGAESASLQLLEVGIYAPRRPTLPEVFPLVTPQLAAKSGGPIGLTPTQLSRRWIVWPAVTFDLAMLLTLATLIWTLAHARTVLRSRSRTIRIARGLCPRCDYTLAQSAHDRCPECGAPLTLSEQAVLQSKRLV